MKRSLSGAVVAAALFAVGMVVFHLVGGGFSSAAWAGAFAALALAMDRSHRHQCGRVTS